MALDFDADPPKHPNVFKLARTLTKGEIIVKRGDKYDPTIKDRCIVDRIEVLDKVITSESPKRVLVWSADDLHYEFKMDETVEILCA